MGGHVAAYLAAIHPRDARAVAILDSSAEGRLTLSDLPPEKIEPFDKLTAGWPLPYPTYEAALRDLNGRYPSKSNVRYFLESLIETPDGYDYMFSRYAMAAISEYSQRWYQRLGQLQCPVWLVRAAKSWELSADVAPRMRALIRDCSYTEISDSDHMVYADNPQFNRRRLSGAALNRRGTSADQPQGERPSSSRRRCSPCIRSEWSGRDSTTPSRRRPTASLQVPGSARFRIRVSEGR
jgi:pimeloyl-ACP methyl ester carboxylesterase